MYADVQHNMHANKSQSLIARIIMKIMKRSGGPMDSKQVKIKQHAKMSWLFVSQAYDGYNQWFLSSNRKTFRPCWVK